MVEEALGMEKAVDLEEAVRVEDTLTIPCLQRLEGGHSIDQQDLSFTA